MDRDAVRRQEAEFYDAMAGRLDPAAMPPRALDPYDESILSALGAVEGRHVLDAGCGAGELTLALLERGAEVTALDVSPGMVELTRARVERFRPGATARFAAAPLERTGLAGRSFDAAVGKWVLHHTDVAGSAPELARLLRPGAEGVFFENQGRNPLLSFARRRLMGLPGVRRFGTADERPLSHADVELLRGEFEHVRLEYPSLYLFELVSRQVLRYRLYERLRALDAAAWRRLPRLRPYGYHVLVRVRAPRRA